MASYARATCANVAVAADDAADSVTIDMDDPVWATLEAGQTVKAALIYVHVGADGVNIPLAHIDSDTTGLLPRALGGGQFKFTVPAGGFVSASQSA